MNNLSRCIDALPIRYIAHAIDKREMKSGVSGGLYGFATRKCLEKVALLITKNNQSASRLELIIEARGSKEDRELARKIKEYMGDDHYRYINCHGSSFLNKMSNSIGLELADLSTNPIARNVLDTEQ